MSEEGTYSAEQVNQLLTCPVCLDRYNCPKILPCQHTVCRSPCMEGLIDRFSRMIKCPTCRAEHFVPRIGVEGFPTNITISGFLDLQAHANTPRPENAAGDFPVSNAAPSIDQSNGASGGTPKKCAVCENEADTVKCFHCSKMVCLSCKESHTGQMKMDVGRLVNQIRRSLPKLSNCISSVEHRGELVKQHIIGVKSEVSNSIERFIKELKDRETMLHSELDTFQQGELRSLYLHQENIEVELASLKSYCDSMESFLNNSNTVPEADLVNIKHQCSEYMQQVRAVESEPMPPLRRSKYIPTDDPLLSAISHFGRIELPSSVDSRVLNRPALEEPTEFSQNRAGAQRSRWSHSTRQPMRTSSDDRRPPPGLPRRHSSPQYSRDFRNSPFVSPSNEHLLGRNSGGSNAYDESWLMPSQSGGTHQSTPTSVYLQSRTNDYMYQMDTNTDDVAAVLEEMRRQEEWELNASIRETSRMRNNHQTANVLGTTTPQQAAIRSTRSERTAGIFGGGGGSDTGRHQPTSNHSQSQARGAVIDDTMRALEDEIHNMDTLVANATANQSSRNTSTTRNSFSTTDIASQSCRNTSLTRNSTGVANATGQGSRNTSTTRNSTSTTNVANQSSRPTWRNNQGDSPPVAAAGAAAIARANHNEAGLSNSNENPGASHQVNNNRNRQPNGNQSQTNTNQSHANNGSHRGRNQQRGRGRGHNRGAATSNRGRNGNGGNNTTGRNGTNDRTNASRRTSNTNMSADSTNSNTAANSVSITPRPRRISQQAPAPASLDRGRTFVQEEPTTVDEANHLPSVSNNGVSFSISLEDGDTEPPSPATTGYNVNYHEKASTLLNIGSGRGNGRDNFTWPRGVAVSPRDGSIVVADSSNHRVKIFDTNGNLTNTFGSYGTNEGEFDCLAGVAVNLLGNIIVADRYNHRIQVLDSSGRFISAFGSEGREDGLLSYPWGVAVDSSGFIYVCDKENHRVQVFQQDGTFVRKFGSLGNQPGKLENPHYLAITSDNKVIVSDSSNHRLQVFTNTGRFIKTISSQGSANGQLKYPKGIAIDPNGFIIVADSGNSRVQIFQPNGRYHYHFGSSGTQMAQFRGLEGLGLSASGTIVVSDKDNHRIQTF